MEKLIQDRIGIFKDDLKSYSANEIVQKHITFGQPYVISGDLYYRLKKKISDYFQIHPTQVIMVGSGKLGFTVVDHPQVGKVRYREFTDTSDIDVAIISESLFTEFWKILYEFERSKELWEKSDEFKKYFFQGWIRPDKMPPGQFKLTKDWWEFFRSITQSEEFGTYQVRAGLYHSWFFYENYYETAVKGCQKEII